MQNIDIESDGNVPTGGSLDPGVKREYSSDMQRQRPEGLMFFSVVNLLLGGMEAIVLAMGVALMVMGDKSVNEMMPVELMLARIANMLLLTISAIGFLKLRYGMGFVCGIALSIYGLFSILVTVLNFNHFPLTEWLYRGIEIIIRSGYYLFLLLMLCFRYHKRFVEEFIRLHTESPGR